MAPSPLPSRPHCTNPPTGLALQRLPVAAPGTLTHRFLHRMAVKLAVYETFFQAATARGAGGAAIAIARHRHCQRRRAVNSADSEAHSQPDAALRHPDCQRQRTPQRQPAAFAVTQGRWHTVLLRLTALPTDCAKAARRVHLQFFLYPPTGQEPKAGIHRYVYH